MRLLENRKPVIWCPAWGLNSTTWIAPVLEALVQNRMLILEMRNRDGTLAAATARNEFVIESADQLWIPHITSGGMLDQLMRRSNAPPAKVSS